MANERFPDDPYRSNLSEDDFRRQARLDNELPPDPALAERPASTGKVAMFAIAIAVALGAIFYGLNNTTINQAGKSSTAQNTVTPRANTDQGMTTGTAPTRMNRPANPPADNAPASK